MTERYGRRLVSKMWEKVNEHRHAVAADGSSAVQASWDAIEEFIDYAFQQNADRKTKE